MRIQLCTAVAWSLAVATFPLFESAAKPLPEGLPAVNAFSAGVGFATVAVPFDPATIYWNPAGVALMGKLETNLTAAAAGLESPGTWAFLVANSPTGDESHFGMGFIRRFVERDGWSYKNFQMVVPLASKVGGGLLPIGVGMKFISESIAEAKWKYGMALDFGALLPLGDELRLGMSSQNLVGSDLETFRRRSWLGASFGSDESQLLVTGQVMLEKRLSRRRMGTHHNVGLMFTPAEDLPQFLLGRVRRGDDVWYTAGVGYNSTKSGTGVQYAFTYDRDDPENRVHVLTYSFGGVQSAVLSPGRR